MTYSPFAWGVRYKCETRDAVSYQSRPCEPDQQQTVLEADVEEAPNIKALRESHEANIKRLRELGKDDYMEQKRKEWDEMRKECQRNRELINKYSDNEYIVHDAAIAVNKNCR